MGPLGDRNGDVFVRDLDFGIVLTRRAGGRIGNDNAAFAEEPKEVHARTRTGGRDSYACFVYA